MAVDDAYTVALLHMDGADASTTFTDESGKSWTAAGNAQIDTAQSKFGGASAIFDGAGDYISANDSADWRLDDGSNSNKWTVDFWIRFNGDPGTAQVGFIQQYVDDSNWWAIYIINNVLYFTIRSGGSYTAAVAQNWNPATATWYHIAIVKDGTNGYLHFVDGTQIGATTTDTDTIPDFAGSVTIGIMTVASAAKPLNGWIDELRISKGVARWTSNFTPPIAEYASPAVSNGFMAFF